MITEDNLSGRRPAGLPGSRLEGTPLGDIRDATAVVAMAAMLFVLLVYRSDAFPMQFWDEARNANNALEAVMDGHWLAPTFKGAIDHWNTKPPLLIWLIAAGMKLGLPPLWALRAPGILAGAATVAMTWSVLRYSLRDRTAANLGAAFLLSSVLYFGIHVTRTGDYDGLVGLFVLGFTLCVWQAFHDPVRPRWLFGAGAFLVAAILTKGVAAVTPLPGLALFALTRPRSLLALMRRWQTWVALLGAVALVIAYYLTRELYDPGYLRAVMDNEIGGRFLQAPEGHTRGPLFYIEMLFQGFEPGFLMLPLCLFTLIDGRPDRRALTGFALSGGVALLLVVSSAKTKLMWYAAPAIPLFSVAAALGLADTLRWLRARDPRLGGLAVVGVGAILALACAGATYQSQHLSENNPGAGAAQLRYGPFLTRLDRSGFHQPLTLVDTTALGPQGWLYYNPIAEFYRRLPRDHWRIDQLTYGHVPAPGTFVATCDPGSLSWLNSHYVLQITVSDDGCTLAHADRSR